MTYLSYLAVTYTFFTTVLPKLDDSVVEATKDKEKALLRLPAIAAISREFETAYNGQNVFEYIDSQAHERAKHYIHKGLPSYLPGAAALAVSSIWFIFDAPWMIRAGKGTHTPMPKQGGVQGHYYPGDYQVLAAFLVTNYCFVAPIIYYFVWSSNIVIYRYRRALYT